MKKRKILCILLALSLATGNGAAAEAKAKKPSLPFKTLKLYQGQTRKIKIKNSRDKAKYLFSSSSPAKISVNKSGLIRARKKGKADIIVREKYKKKSKKIGTIKVTCKKKPSGKKSPAPNKSSAPSAASEKPQSTLPAETSQTPAKPTPSPTGTPEAEVTPPPAGEKVLYVKVKNTALESVEGSTCRVDMQYFTAEVSESFFTGKTSDEGTDVIKSYKNGTTKTCARYILTGNDVTGKKCSIYIEDNGESESGKPTVTKPVIFTNSKALSWLETIDIQGKVTDNGNGEKTIDFIRNPQGVEPVTPPPVVFPDTSLEYPNEFLTFTVAIGKSVSVSGGTGKGTMIHFKGTAGGDNFTGEAVADFVDARMKFKGQVETLSARYILSGKDKKGNACRIYVENNGIDNNGTMVTEPIIITDNPDFAWIETAKLHGTVTTSPSLTIHLWSAK